MLLYATTTSERGKPATKGGNERIAVELTAGKNRQVMLYASIEVEETPTQTIYRLWNGDVCVDVLKEVKD